MSLDPMMPHHELAHDMLTKMSDYVSRGRHLAGMDIEALEVELQSVARRVSVEGDDPCNNLAIYDALAEFDLRGIERPFHLIAHDIEIMACCYKCEVPLFRLLTSLFSNLIEKASEIKEVLERHHATKTPGVSI